MPNIMQKSKITPLAVREENIKGAKKKVEKHQWYIASELWLAREEHFADDEKGFREWADDKCGYVFSSVNRLIETYERFKDNKEVTAAQKSEKPIPFSKLQELRKTKVKPAVRQRIVKKLVSKKPPTQAEVAKEVKQSLPDFRPPPIKYQPEFAERAKRIGGRFRLKPEYLLEVQEDSSAELVRLVAKHWKGKYHPDKGGAAEIFNAICEAEKELLAKRGEK